MFVCSADLVDDSGECPWMTKATPDAKKLEAMIAFLKMQQSGACNVLLGFDGGIKEARDQMNKLPSPQEIVIVYSSSWNEWAKRHVFLGSCNSELGYVTLPMSRCKWPCKERPVGFKGAGEKTSHSTSMTGVAMTPRTRLPRIGVEDKAKVFGASGRLPAKWVKNIPAGCPLFWGETKSVAYWVQTLTELNAKCVVDVTPGSGALAEAAVSMGIQYCGFVANLTHMGWLSNVVDRAAVRHMVKSGTFLYQQELAESLMDMYADVVAKEEDGAEGDDHADDCVRESDDEEDDAAEA